MNFYLIVCALVLLEKLQMCRLSKGENYYFFYVQSGINQLNACVIKELSVKKFDRSYDTLWFAVSCSFTMCRSGYHRKQRKQKRCRLLYGFPALIQTNKTSDETVRYQKVKYTFVFDMYELKKIFS